jgi:transposase
MCIRDSSRADGIEVPNVEEWNLHRQTGGSEMKHSKTIVGVDTAKRVFQLHWVEMETGEMVSLQVKREKFLEHFANRAPCLIAMEACGGSQHWARQLLALGHQVKLLPGKRVKPFVAGNKNDAQDARAIWTAVQQPGIKTVAIKTEEQQTVLALHRMRQQLVKFRTAQINGLRGLLAEYGEVMPQGKAGVRKGIPEALQRLSNRLPAMVIDTLREQWDRLARLDDQVGDIERRLKQWHKTDDASRRIAAIPGVGLLTATAAVATMGDAGAFRSGREFAAWLGLVPRQSGTGGRVRLLGISKRGDTYLRTLLVHGARAVLTNSKAPSAWAVNLAERRPRNVAVVALANKMARTIWALLAHDRVYQKGFVSQPA